MTFRQDDNSTNSNDNRTNNNHLTFFLHFYGSNAKKSDDKKDGQTNRQTSAELFHVRGQNLGFGLNEGILDSIQIPGWKREA